MKVALGLFSIFLLLAPSISSAHVGYVVDETDFTEKGGTDYAYFFSPLSEPVNIALIVGFLALLAVLYIGFHKTVFYKKEHKHLERKSREYYELIPWMLRLSVGIALIGAGSANVLISPVFADAGIYAMTQLILGFLLLIGLFTIPVAIAVVVLYLIAVFQNMELLGTAEFLAAAVSIVMLAQCKPGFDDLIGNPLMIKTSKKLKEYVPFVLRLGIGFGLMYSAFYEKILNPHVSELVVHQFDLMSVIPVSAAMWVFSAGVIEFFVGLLLVLGLFTRYASAVAFLILSLTFFYFGEDVYSHITLFGVLSVLYVTGGGMKSLDAMWKNR